MNEQRDKEFRKWYDDRQGTKSEGFAYDVWCAAWKAAQQPARQGFHMEKKSQHN
jgi:hypothetical protein